VAGDLVWIGNWGDDERSRELREFLLQPIAALRLSARVHGVRYTDAARAQLEQAGVEYCGWLPNHRVPELFSRFRVTLHVPRRWYAERLPGIPTIRVFEALACGIPLISSPWHDSDGLFRPGEDFLLARDGAEMQQLLRAVLHDHALARALAEQGRARVLARHTCAHRVDELLAILDELREPKLHMGQRDDAIEGTALAAAGSES
jgi:spore maturation protein CgeB